jgi:hypothetical protein
MACRAVKYTPKITVKSSPCKAEEKFLLMRAWCAQVTDTPDDKRTIVFSRGTWKGLKVARPVGGQTLPNSTVGDKLL